MLHWQGSVPSSSLDEQGKADTAGGHASAGKNSIATLKKCKGINRDLNCFDMDFCI